MRVFTLVVFVALAGASGCTKKASPSYRADQFTSSANRRFYPPGSLACKVDADCTTISFNITREGQCCHNCAYPAINVKFKERASKICHSYPMSGCAKYMCKGRGRATCESGVCTTTIVPR